MGYMYSWGEEFKVDIDSLLLDGEGLSDSQVRHFAHWLRTRSIEENFTAQNIKGTTYNRILYYCEDTTRWFRSQFTNLGKTPNARRLAVDRLNRMRHTVWRDARQRLPHFQIAPDLSEDEIKTIESYLLPSNRIKTGTQPDVACRDYLIWRLAIEFGLRKGEILALRLQDCPNHKSNYIRIVRIEERGKDYFDPRGKHAPRPKTLSRDLGYLLSNSPIPKLISTYRSKYRRVWPTDVKLKSEHPFALDHDFLFVGRRSGEPMSASTMQDLAERIAGDTRISFHWHLTRHALFNRAYAAVSLEKDNQAQIMDLVYFGGWRDPSSLEIYSRRATRDRARVILKHWQDKGNIWPALS